MTRFRTIRTLALLGAFAFVQNITLFGSSIAYATPRLQADGLPVEIVGKSGDAREQVFYLRIGDNLHQVRDCESANNLWELTGNSPVPVYDKQERYILDHLGVQKAVGLSCDPTKLAEVNEDNPVYLEEFDVLYFQSGKDGEYYKTNTNCAYEFASTLFKSDRRSEKSGSPPGATVIELACGHPARTIAHRLYFRHEAQTNGLPGYRLILAQQANNKITATLSICKIDGEWLADVPKATAAMIQKLDEVFDFGIGARLSPLSSNKTNDADPCLNVCSGPNCATGMNPSIDHQLALDAAGRSVWLPSALSTTKFVGCAALLEPFVGPVFDNGDMRDVEWEEAILAGADMGAQSEARSFDCLQVKSCRVQLTNATYSLADLNDMVRLDAEGLKTVAHDCTADGSIERIEFVIHGTVRLSATSSDLSVDLSDASSVNEIAFVGASGSKAKLRFDYKCEVDAISPCPDGGADGLALFVVGKGGRLEFDKVDIALGEVSENLLSIRGFVGVRIGATSAEPGWVFLHETVFRGTKEAPLDLGIDARWSSVHCLLCKIENATMGVKIVSGRLFIQGGNPAQVGEAPEATISAEETAISAENSRVVAFGGKIKGRRLVHLGQKAQAVINGTNFEITGTDSATATGFDVFDVPYLDDGNEDTSAMTLRIMCIGFQQEQCRIAGIPRDSFEVFSGKNGRIRLGPLYSHYYETGESSEEVPPTLLQAVLRCGNAAGGHDDRGYYYRGLNWCD